MTKKTTDKKQPEHYVNNKEFTAAVAEHNALYKKAISEDVTPPRMTEYIGECIYKIATRLSTRPNFINYTYRDEMISDRRVRETRRSSASASPPPAQRDPPTPHSRTPRRPKETALPRYQTSVRVHRNSH